MILANMLDGNGNVIARVKLQALDTSAAPTAGNYVNGIAGAMYFNNTSAVSMFHNGTEWVPVAKIVGTTGQTTVTYTGTPASAVIGLDTNLSALYMPTSGGTFTGTIKAPAISATTISATNLYGSLTGVATGATSAAQADKLKTAQNFSITGPDVSAAAVAFDGTGGVTLTSVLNPTGVTSGTYGSSITIPVLTIDTKGRVTNATTSAINISGANGGTVTSVSVSSNVLTIANPTVTVSGTIGVNLPTTGTAGTYDKVVTDSYGRVTSGRATIATDLPTLSGYYVPLSGGTMTGGLGTPSITVTGTGITINNDGQGVTFFGGASIYKNNGGGIRIKRHAGDVDPMVENAAGTTAWIIYHTGNLVGSQTGHNHYTQFSGVSGINYNSSNGQIGLVSATQAAAGMTKVTYDQYGRIISSGYITSSDVPTLPYIAITDKGAPSGVAIYDGTGKVYTSALPDVIVGQLKYGGVWNATTNTPTLLSASQVSGTYYIVQTSGNSIPAGGLSTQTITLVSAISATTGIWNIGDWVVSNGTTWDKVDNTDSISTWNGRTGSVIPSAGDYNAGQITSTPVGLVTGTDVQTNLTAINSALNTRLPLSGGAMTGALTNTVSISSQNISAVNLYDTNFGGLKVLVSNSDKSIGESSLPSSALPYLSAVSADIQMQLNSKMTGTFTNGDDYCIPVFLSAGGFQNSSSYIVGAAKEKLVITDKTQAVTDDYHSPGFGIEAAFQASTSATPLGMFWNLDTKNSVKLWQGTWGNPIAWTNTLKVTSAGTLSLPAAYSGTSGLLAIVDTSGTVGKYTLTSADLPNISTIYMPLSGGTFTGPITGTGATFTSAYIRSELRTDRGVTISNVYNPTTFIGYNVDGGAFAITINGSDYIDLNLNNTIDINKPTTFYSSATFNNPVYVNSTVAVAGSVTAAMMSASSIIYAPTISATQFLGGTLSEGGVSLSAKYLPLSGGNMTGNITFNYNAVTGDNLGIYGNTGSGNDGWRIVGQTSGSDGGILEIATADNGNEPIVFRQYNNINYATSAIVRTLYLLDAGGNTQLPGTLKVPATPSTGGTYSGTLKVDTTGLVYKDTTVVDHRRWYSSAVSIPTGSYTISATHNLRYKYVTVKCFDNSTGQTVWLEPNYSTSTTATVYIPTLSSQLLTTTLIIES